MSAPGYFLDLQQKLEPLACVHRPPGVQNALIENEVARLTMKGVFNAEIPVLAAPKLAP